MCDILKTEILLLPLLFNLTNLEQDGYDINFNLFLLRNAGNQQMLFIKTILIELFYRTFCRRNRSFKNYCQSERFEPRERRITTQARLKRSLSRDQNRF